LEIPAKTDKDEIYGGVVDVLTEHRSPLSQLADVRDNREEVVAKSDSCLQSASDSDGQLFPYRIGEELPTKRPRCPTIATAQ
jgi:hypothetical protein